MGGAPEIRGLHQIALPVADLASAVAFYRDVLGLKLIAEFDPPGLAFFDIAGTRLMLERVQGPAKAAGTLYLRVDDVDASHRAMLARGVIFEHPPTAVHHDQSGQFGQPGETEWMAFLRDPAGYLIAIVSRK